MLGIFPLGGAAIGAFPDPPKRVGWIDIDKPVPAPRRRHDSEKLEQRLEDQRPFGRKKFDQLVEAERLASEAERLATGIKIKRQRERALKAARKAQAFIQTEFASPHEAPGIDERLETLQLALTAFAREASSAASRARAISELNVAAAAALRQQEIEEENFIDELLLLL